MRQTRLMYNIYVLEDTMPDNTPLLHKNKKRAHHRSGAYLRDAVYGANDGIVTTFVVVAGVVGASLPPVTILLLGAANLLADGFSMATSNYLGTKSELEYMKHERGVEEWEIQHIPTEEMAEVRSVLADRGYQGEDLEEMVRLIAKNKNFWLDFMMSEELGFSLHDAHLPLKGAAVTMAAFVVAGSLPILPYFLFSASSAAFFFAMLATGVALFAVGSLRSLFTGKRWTVAGFEVLLMGGAAAVIAYATGALIRNLVG